jgi:hypothetical protein
MDWLIQRICADSAGRPIAVDPYGGCGAGSLERRLRAWPSGRQSFDEFLLQWPCEIEFPADFDDEAFVDEAYRAILLRGSAIAERGQYLKLLRDGAVSREWIMEDLLASQELHSLERRVRVVYGAQMITEPGTSGQDDMPVVNWPALG